MTLCECGCGGEASPGKRFISGHNARVNTPMKKGKKLSEEAKRKRKEAIRLNKLLKEGKIELPFCACGCGGRVTKLGNKYIIGHHINIKNPMKDPKVAKKTGDAQIGEKNHNYGKHHSDETIKKMKESHPDNSGEKCYWYGKNHSEATKQLMSDGSPHLSGEKCPLYGLRGEETHNWKGGISFEPYCEKFDKDFKERVRNFFDRKCYVCGMNEIENGRKLDIHHVNYDKMVCCNDVKPLFVPLCKSCHAKTQGDRKYWEEFFTISLEYLTDGKCFLPKKEPKKCNTS